MKRLNYWLKTKLRKWLGVGWNEKELFNTNRRFASQICELTTLSADVSVHGQSSIIIVSRVGGGRVKIIQAHFAGLKDVTEFIKYCELRYGAKTAMIDVPQTNPMMRF